MLARRLRTACVQPHLPCPGAYRKLVGIVGGLFLLAGAHSQAADGFWSAGGGGSWASANNWNALGGIANGTDNNAYFGFDFEPSIPANATFSLDGTQTIGNLYFASKSGAANWVFNGGTLDLEATFNAPSITVGPAGMQVTINSAITGNSGLVKYGNGTLVLAAANNYTGDTVVKSGTLTVTGSTGTGNVLVQGGTFNATGVIGGPMVVQPGGTFSLSTPFSTLAMNNTLTLDAGSMTYINVNSLTLAHDTIQGLSSVVYGGTLVVNNVGGVPAVGDSFQIFSAASASGNFSSIIPSPGTGLNWQFNPATGTLAVVSITSQPVISSLTMNGGNMILSVINGTPQSSNFVLSSTDLSMPMSNWTRIATNLFDATGACLFTNAINPGNSQQFFLIQVPAGQ